MTSEPSKDDKHYIKLKPVTPDMLDITWDGNDATIPGTMLKIQDIRSGSPARATSAYSSSMELCASEGTP